jgi:hypothetical protein
MDWGGPASRRTRRGFPRIDQSPGRSATDPRYKEIARLKKDKEGLSSELDKASQGH